MGEIACFFVFRRNMMNTRGTPKNIVSFDPLDFMGYILVISIFQLWIEMKLSAL